MIIDIKFNLIINTFWIVKSYQNIKIIVILSIFVIAGEYKIGCIYLAYCGHLAGSLLLVILIPFRPIWEPALKKPSWEPVPPSYSIRSC